MDALQPAIHTDWLVPRNLPDVVAIEQLSYTTPWTEKAFKSCLARSNCVGLVAELGNRVVGFVIFETTKKRILLLNMAVHPKFRRNGVATTMLASLVRRLSNNKQELIVAEVRESNLAAQLFFRSLNFRAVEVFRKYYDDTEEDAYKFEYWRTDDCHY